MTASRMDEAVVSRIPITARNLGCIGPASTRLKQLWARRNPSGDWSTLDLDRDSTAGLANGLDCLLVPAAEHIDGLRALLRSVLPLLHDSGILILDLPNPSHWRLLDQFLRGQPLTAAGSVETTELVLAELGLRSVERFANGIDHAAFAPFLRSLRPTIQAQGIDEAELASRMAPCRIVWRAMRRQPPALRIVQRVLPPIVGFYEARMEVPMRGLATVPGFIGISSVRPSFATVAGDVPAIVIDQRRTLGADALPFIRRLRRHGCILVSEADDDPDHWPGHAQTDYLSFRATHAVQTSTEALAARLRPFNPETKVLPNSLEILPEPRNFKRPDRLTLFFGALNRFADLAPLLPALNAVLAAADSRMAVEVVHDRAAFDAIGTPHKRFTPTATYAAYRSIMADCEIALLPLQDTRFNQMKSDLKFIEAAGSRLAVIASPTVYAGSIRHGETGMIARNVAEWRAFLETLLADPGYARTMAENARAEIAGRRMLADATVQRLAWYRSLLDRRAELDAALLQRVPELGGKP